MRFEVLQRDNFSCIICGRSAPEVELQVDHIIPWSIVKEHSLDNLATTCKECSLGKRDKILSEEETKKIKARIQNQ
ncbi:MAG: HNH endonuclease [Candidatus Heimdallarchaeota archaeon]|nr:HNH endonuclease [Candidatus Heimdallarchaeota archaeon]MCG3254876.1 HNH endonuclease [Candidatus Heimdallarchaeota archaeon]MCK4609951.1 HNH endonuclease [Candidatus Heimdallarchaeota archaeon]